MELCASPGTTELLAQVRQASGEGLGALLELYRDYLGVLAQARLGARLRGIVNPSDLVQQTFLEAFRDFRRQVSLDQRPAVPGDTAAGPGAALASPVSSPSAQAQQHETTAVLADR